MTIDRMIQLINVERECMLTKSHGACEGKCEDCDLVQDDYELEQMYDYVLYLMQEEKKADEEERKQFTQEVFDWLGVTKIIPNTVTDMQSPKLFLESIKNKIVDDISDVVMSDGFIDALLEQCEMGNVMIDTKVRFIQMGEEI